MVPSFISGITLTRPSRQSQSANQYRCIESNRHPGLPVANRFLPQQGPRGNMGGLVLPRRFCGAASPTCHVLIQVPLTIPPKYNSWTLYSLYWSDQPKNITNHPKEQSSHEESYAVEEGWKSVIVSGGERYFCGLHLSPGSDAAVDVFTRTARCCAE
jgi:hypothetical protein